MFSRSRTTQHQTKALAGLSAAALFACLSAAPSAAHSYAVPSGFTRALRIIQTSEMVKQQQLPAISLVEAA